METVFLLIYGLYISEKNINSNQHEHDTELRTNIILYSDANPILTTYIEVL